MLLTTALSSRCSLTLCFTGSCQTQAQASSSPAHSFVCTQEQYIFVHQCLLLWLSGRASAWWEDRNKYPTGIQHTVPDSGTVLLVTVTYDDVLIRCLLFPSGPQTQGAGLNANQRAQDQPHCSSGQGARTVRRRHHHHRHTPPSEPQQNTIQNLLRRFLPSSSSSQNPASWTNALWEAFLQRHQV